MTLSREPTKFEQRVYDACSLVPEGMVTTYNAIAKKLKIASPRAVWQALKRNPFAPHCPCHRVVSSDGTIGGFNGKTMGTSITRKIRILAEEGIKVKKNKIVDFEMVLHEF